MEATAVFLPGEFRGHSMEGYSPWSHKELDTTAQLTLLLSFFSPALFKNKQICVLIYISPFLNGNMLMHIFS